jgi:hypothetical protein
MDSSIIIEKLFRKTVIIFNKLSFFFVKFLDYFFIFINEYKFLSDSSIIFIWSISSFSKTLIII